jgi:hypothetical protein
MNHFATWVKPFYLDILGGSFTNLQGIELDSFISRVNEARSRIDESVIEEMLSASGWRERITGSWFAGLKEWNRFSHQIGKLLIESNRVYADQGYCFALGRFADTVSVDYLTRYLDKYLLQLDCFCDQDWAMATLMWIDDLHGSKHAKEFVAADGLWQRFVANKPEWSLDRTRSRYASMMEFCVKNFDAI